jgi:hypothetical protein
MRNISDKSYRGNNTCNVQKLFVKNLAIYEIMWMNNVEPDWQQMTMWHMHIACWVPKAAITPSEYVLLIVFPLQQWLHKCSSLLH